MGTNNTVKMGDPELGNVFIPQVLSIPVGTTVHWVNADEEPHTVTSNPRTLHCNPTSTENFDSGPVDPDGTFEYTFNTHGSFNYHCEFHAQCGNGAPGGMIGTINVT
jgi:plastocyanin